MSHNRNLISRRRTMITENNQRPRNAKFWFVFLALFFLWYILLYGFDWSSFVAVPRPEDPTTAEIGSPDSPIPQAHTKINNDPKTEQRTEEKTEEEPKTEEETEEKTEQEPDEIEDLAAMEKEIEALLPKEESHIEKKMTSGGRRPCTGRYIYVHDIPARFNREYIENCKSLNKWHDMCPYFANGGLGESLGNPGRLFQRSGWYVTNQFSLEVIFHNRMRQYECLTKDSSEAAAIFVPYYSGLDVSRFLFDSYNTSVKDADVLELLRLLRERPEWGVMGGRDHFMVSGRITWDLRREGDEDKGWGNKLMIMPESRNMTMLAIESSPWDRNDFAIPYPTYFHPSSDGQVREWQRKMRGQKRRSLFCFAGAPRPNMDGSIRGEIMAQCAASRRKCRMIECKDSKNNCLKPSNVMRIFQSSVFCLQPPGDSFTRRSTFDSIVAGCIPVFFSPGSAYVQYLWHLPKDFASYSVLIPEGDVKRKKVSIESVLSRIPASKVSAMRDNVIKMIPNVIYADPRARLEKLEDAFDLAVRGVIERVGTLRKEMKEGRNSSAEFDSEFSWKYYTFGHTKPHEWDSFFKRSG